VFACRTSGWTIQGNFFPKARVESTRGLNFEIWASTENEDGAVSFISLESDQAHMLDRGKIHRLALAGILIGVAGVGLLIAGFLLARFAWVQQMAQPGAPPNPALVGAAVALDLLGTAMLLIGPAAGLGVPLYLHRAKVG
jgi:hypothetical protein